MFHTDQWRQVVAVASRLHWIPVTGCFAGQGDYLSAVVKRAHFVNERTSWEILWLLEKTFSFLRRPMNLRPAIASLLAGKETCS